MNPVVPSVDSDAPGAAIDRLFDALARGDVAATGACCTPDVRIWHGFDRIEQDLAQATIGWEQFVSVFPERAFVDVRRSPAGDGFVQRHVMVARPAGGEPRAWPICIVVTVRDGLIARLEEYMDRAGSYSVDAVDHTPADLAPLTIVEN